MYTSRTRLCTFAADLHAQSVIINKVSASELRRKFIESALLVGQGNWKKKKRYFQQPCQGLWRCFEKPCKLFHNFAYYVRLLGSNFWLDRWVRNHLTSTACLLSLFFPIMFYTQTELPDRHAGYCKLVISFFFFAPTALPKPFIILPPTFLYLQSWFFCVCLCRNKPVVRFSPFFLFFFGQKGFFYPAKKNPLSPPPPPSPPPASLLINIPIMLLFFSPLLFPPVLWRRFFASFLRIVDSAYWSIFFSSPPLNLSF